MFLSPGNRQLIKKLGLPIWKLRKQSKSNIVVSSKKNKAYFYYNDTSDSFVSSQPSRPIDCLILGAFGGIIKNEPINITSDKHGALLRNMLEAAGLFSHNLFFLDVEAIQSSQKDKSLTPKTGGYTNSLFDQLRLISPKVIYAMGQVIGGLNFKPETSLSNERQKVYLMGQFNALILFSLELSYLLEKGWNKQKAWEDLIYLTEILRKRS